MLSTSKLFFNPSAGGATDPYFKYVPLLLETTSTNGQQNNTFLDSSTNNFTITRNGTPTQGSVTPYWPNGYWSNNFNGSSDYLTTPANAAFAFGTGDFTIEAWVNTNSSATQRIVSAANGSGQPYEFLMVNSGSNIYLNFFDGTTDTGTGTNYVTQNQWVHVAVSRQGTALKVFINGTVYGTSTNNTNLTNAGVLTIGRYSPSAANYFSGYISNLRIVKGVAVYTGNFTPPTTPLAATQSAGTNISAITGTATSLLTCQSNRFRDNSAQPTPFVITANGTPKVQAFQPFSPTASYTPAAYGGGGYFNSTTDYLSVPYNSALNLVSGDFTIETWVYCTGLTAQEQQILNKDGVISASFAQYALAITSSGNLVASLGNGNGLSPSFTDYGASTPIPRNVWNHVALVRTGTTIKVFVNGAQVTSTAQVTAMTDGGKPLLIGYQSGYPAGFYFNGYISNTRIVKGTAVYTAAFTPPTAPVTAITNTSLLLNYTNAGIYDASAQTNAITVGDAQASTTVAKWSPTSIKLDGTGDYLDLGANQAFVLGAGDFTVEGWVYPTSTAAGHWMFLQGNATANAAVRIGCQSNQVFLLMSTNGTTNTVSSGLVGSVPINNWTYLAVTRSGTTVTLYVNGTSVYTSTALSTSALMTGVYNLVGRIDPTNLQYFTGYVQDVRITKGVARTIATPTSAFPTR